MDPSPDLLQTSVSHHLHASTYLPIPQLTNPFPSSHHRHSSAILPSLSTKEPQASLHSLESNHTPLGEEKNIALCSLHALSTLIRDFKVTIDNNLHFIVRVGVDERGARVEAVEASGDGGGWFGRAVLAVCVQVGQLVHLNGIKKWQIRRNVECFWDGVSYEEKTSAKKAFSFAINGSVLVNSVWALA